MPRERAAVEREGAQTAFAKRHKVDRSRVNRILSRQLRASGAIAKALGDEFTLPISLTSQLATVVLIEIDTTLPLVS